MKPYRTHKHTRQAAASAYRLATTSCLSLYTQAARIRGEAESHSGCWRELSLIEKRTPKPPHSHASSSKQKITACRLTKKKRKENARRPAGKPVPGLCLSCLTVIFQGPASQTDARVSKRRDNQCKEESDATHLSPANTPRCSTVLMMIAFLVLQLKMSNIPLWCLSRNHATD